MSRMLVVTLVVLGLVLGAFAQDPTVSPTFCRLEDPKKPGFWYDLNPLTKPVGSPDYSVSSFLFPFPFLSLPWLLSCWLRFSHGVLRPSFYLPFTSFFPSFLSFGRSFNFVVLVWLRFPPKTPRIHL